MTKSNESQSNEAKQLVDFIFYLFPQSLSLRCLIYTISRMMSASHFICSKHLSMCSTTQCYKAAIYFIAPTDPTDQRFKESTVGVAGIYFVPPVGLSWVVFKANNDLTSSVRILRTAVEFPVWELGQKGANTGFSCVIEYTSHCFMQHTFPQSTETSRQLDFLGAISRTKEPTQTSSIAFK